MMGNANPPSVHPVVYDQITASCIWSVALHVKGAAGPSGLDVHCWRRLCTLLAKRLCTTLVDPKGISPLLASHLIVLDKCSGLKPIGISETHMRITVKAVLLITMSDLLDAAGPRQPCAGQIASIEAAAHVMRALFSHKNTDAVLLVDATNVFNPLNTQIELCNIQHLCPPFPIILIHTYRETPVIFVDGQVLSSEETQGDPLAMPMYGIATIPLVDQLSDIQDATQVW